MSNLDKALAYAQSNHERYLLSSKDTPCILQHSTLPDTQLISPSARLNGWRRRCSAWACRTSRWMPTGGYPVVYGEYSRRWQANRAGLWATLMCSPLIRSTNGNAPCSSRRCAATSCSASSGAPAGTVAGQSHSVLKALEAYSGYGAASRSTSRSCSKEELAQNSPALVSAHRAKLQSDLFLNTDSGIEHPGSPSLYALRGMAYFELWSTALVQDLHCSVRWLGTQPGAGVVRARRGHARRQRP